MHLVLKMPVLLIATMIGVLIWCFSMVLSILAYVSGVIGRAMAMFAVLVFFGGERQQALLLLVVAYLVGTLGLPMVAVCLFGKFQDICDTMMDAVV